MSYDHLKRYGKYKMHDSDVQGPILGMSIPMTEPQESPDGQIISQIATNLIATFLCNPPTTQMASRWSNSRSWVLMAIHLNCPKVQQKSSTFVLSHRSKASMVANPQVTTAEFQPTEECQQPLCKKIDPNSKMNCRFPKGRCRYQTASQWGTQKCRKEYLLFRKFQV